MKMDARFWIAQIVFQIIFGLAIFGITRAIYVKDLSPTRPAAPVSRSQPAPPAPAPIPSLSESDPVRLGERADEWFKLGDYPRAVEAYSRLLELDPNNPEHYNNLGISLHYQGRTAEAVEILRRGSAKAAAYPRLWLTLGFVQARAGDYVQARSAFERAIEIEPESGVAQEARRMLQQLP